MSPPELAQDNDFQLHFNKIRSKLDLLLTEWQRVQAVAHQHDLKEAGRRVLLVQEFMEMLDACQKPDIEDVKPTKRKRLKPMK